MILITYSGVRIENQNKIIRLCKIRKENKGKNMLNKWKSINQPINL